MDADAARRAFMRRAVELSAERMREGRRRAVRRRHRQGRQGHRRGLEQGHLDQRPDRACRGDARSAAPARSSARSRSPAARSIRAASPARCASSAIYWARLDRIYFANSREDAAAIGFDDELIYGEVAKPIERAHDPDDASSPLPEAKAVFAEWQAQARQGGVLIERVLMRAGDVRPARAPAGTVVAGRKVV